MGSRLKPICVLWTAGQPSTGKKLLPERRVPCFTCAALCYNHSRRFSRWSCQSVVIDFFLYVTAETGQRWIFFNCKDSLWKLFEGQLWLNLFDAASCSFAPSSCLAVVEWILRMLSFISAERNLLWSAGAVRCSLVCKTSTKGFGACWWYYLFTMHCPFSWQTFCSKRLEMLESRRRARFVAGDECLNRNQFAMLNIPPFGFQSTKKPHFLKAKIKYSKWNMYRFLGSLMGTRQPLLPEW